MKPGPLIDYKQLRRINPQTARQAVIEYLKTNGNNVSNASRVFGITRPVIYDIIKKNEEGDLRDRPRTPKHQPHKTKFEIEDTVIEAKNKTRLGPERLSRYLKKYGDVYVPAGTIRHILRRNRQKK